MIGVGGANSPQHLSPDTHHLERGRAPTDERRPLTAGVRHHQAHLRRLAGRLAAHHERDARRLLPVRVSLAAGAITSLGLAVDARPLAYVPLVVLAALSYGVLFTPAFALIADGAEHVGLAQGMAFGLMNAAWAVGAMVGPAAAGALAAATGDWIPFVLAAAVCASALAALRSAHERPAVLVDRLPGDAARAGRQ